MVPRCALPAEVRRLARRALAAVLGDEAGVSEWAAGDPDVGDATPCLRRYGDQADVAGAVVERHVLEEVQWAD